MEIEGFFAESDSWMLFAITQLIVNAGNQIWTDVWFRVDIVMCMVSAAWSVIWIFGTIRGVELDLNEDGFCLGWINGEFVMDNGKFLPSYL